MSGDERNAAELARGSTSVGPAPDAEQPRIDLGRVHRGLAQLIRQGVIVPNGGDYAPKDVQDEDGGGGEHLDE